MLLTQQQAIVISGLFDIENAVEREICLASDLTILELLILLNAGYAPHGIPMKQLSEQLLVNLKHVDTVCSKLESSHLVYRSRNHSGDRRAYSIIDTDNGIRRAEIAMECIQLRMEVLFASKAEETLAFVISSVSSLGNEEEKSHQLFHFLTSLYKENFCIRAVFSNENLSYLQGIILIYIASSSESISLSDVHKHFGTPRSAIIPPLLYLEADGFITLLASELDSTEQYLGLTANGLEIARLLSEQIRQKTFIGTEESDSIIPGFAEIIRLKRK